MSFEDKIKTWVSIDNKIKEHNEELRELRNKRSIISNEVYETVNDNNLSNATIQISDGRLKFQSVKVPQPLTIKFIKECLDDLYDNEEEVNEILKFIKKKREANSKYIDDIKRYYE